VTHRDDQGNLGKTRAGDVQVMSAGTGSHLEVFAWCSPLFSFDNDRSMARICSGLPPGTLDPTSPRSKPG
jgi:hypothetical protein